MGKIDEFFAFTRGKDLVVEEPEKIIDVPYEVQVPRVEVVKPVERTTEIKDVIVENVLQIVKVRENVQYETIDKELKVENDYTETTRKYVPHFVQQQINSTKEFVDPDSLKQAIDDAQ